MKAYMLICTGIKDCVENRFTAVCKTLFRDNPLESDMYRSNVDEFLNDCLDGEKHMFACQKGTEKLTVKEFEII